jgi:CelD/BcsL family acetyltransferase involved in cellulose biosynthesis
MRLFPIGTHMHSAPSENLIGECKSRPTPAVAPEPTASCFSVKSIVTEKEISNLEADWIRLSETAEFPNVFMTFDWFRAWNRRLTQENSHRRPHIFVLRKDQEVIGISPFVLRLCSRFGFVVRKIEFVGEHSDYNDFVLGGDATNQIAAVALFLAQTSDEWDLIELRDLREAGGQIPRIETALARANLLYRIRPEQESCPFLPIDADVSVLTKTLSGHVRRTLRKRIERANIEGLSERIIENPHQEHGLLEKLIDLERRKHNSAGPFIGRYPEVFRWLFDALGPRGWVYVAVLERDEDLVAFQLGFRCGDKLWDYSKAYDRTFSRFAPGTMLVHAVLDYGFSRGYDEYDFLRGGEPYKMVWSSGQHRRVRLLVWNRRWISRVRKFAYSDLRRALHHTLP